MIQRQEFKIKRKIGRNTIVEQYIVTDYEQTYARNVMLDRIPTPPPPSRIKGGQTKSPLFIFAKGPF